MMEPDYDVTHGHRPGARWPLRTRVGGWMHRAESDLRAADPQHLAAALRDGLELAAEELRVEDEARETAVEAAERRALRYATLFDEVPVALLTTGPDGHVLEANACARRLLAPGPRTLQGGLLVRHVALEDQLRFRATLAAVGRTGGQREVTLRLRHPAGAERAVIATVRADRRAAAADGPARLYWVLREDGDERELELL